MVGLPLGTCFRTLYHVALINPFGWAARFAPTNGSAMTRIRYVEMSDKKALGQRIASVRGQHSVNQFAAMLGVHKNTLNRYETGERIPDATFMAALARLGVNLHWLVTGLGPAQVLAADISADLIADQIGMSQAVDGDTADYVRVAELRVDDGRRQAPVKAFAFKRQWLQSALDLEVTRLCLVQAQGNSMAPSINHGDWALVDTRAQHREQLREGLFVLRLSGSLLLRRLEVLPGQRYRARPANPDYSELELDATSLGHEDGIVGRVVWVGQRLV